MRGDIVAHLETVIRQAYADRMPYAGRRIDSRRIRCKADRWDLRAQVAGLRALRTQLPREAVTAIRDALEAVQTVNHATDSEDPEVWIKTIEAFDRAYPLQ
jgi:hypothetical protein